MGAVIDALENLYHLHAGFLLPAEDGEREAEIVTMLRAAVVLRAEDDGLARLPYQPLRRARQHRALDHEHVSFMLHDRSADLRDVAVRPRRIHADKSGVITNAALPGVDVFILVVELGLKRLQFPGQVSADRPDTDNQYIHVCLLFQRFDMSDPLVKGELLQKHTLVQHAPLCPGNDVVPDLRGHRLKQNLVVPVVVLKALFCLIAVLRVHRIEPDRFVQHVVGAVDENCRVVFRLFHHAAVEEVLHQPAIGVDHAGIGLRDVQRVLAADGAFAPFPQVQWDTAVFHVLRHFQRKAVVTAVLMTLHIRMPHDAVVQKELSAVDLPVDKVLNRKFSQYSNRKLFQPFFDGIFVFPD